MLFVKGLFLALLLRLITWLDIVWNIDSFALHNCTSIYMSAHETQLTDGKFSSILTYPNCVRVNQCYGFIVNIQRSIALCKLYLLSDEMRHFLFLSHKKLYFLMTINPFIIRFVNVNISSLHIPNCYLPICLYGVSSYSMRWH
jgi:hypothetical protein